MDNTEKLNTEKLNTVSMLLELMGDVFVRVDDNYIDVKRTKAEALELADKLRPFGWVEDLGVLNDTFGVISFNTFDYKISTTIAYEAVK